MKISFTEFLARARAKHKNRYEYNEDTYSQMTAKILIICSIHGEFWQGAGDHIKGQGCKKCQYETMRINFETFVSRARKIHGDYYGYDKPSYTCMDNKVVIICPKHGKFRQDPWNHVNGCGCKNCTRYGFCSNLPGILYYLKIKTSTHTLYKIGITNLSVKERYSVEDFNKITVLSEIQYKIGREAYAEEQRILKKFNKYLYQSTDILFRSVGTTEIFIKDVLGQD